jgi:hypothetical protein
MISLTLLQRFQRRRLFPVQTYDFTDVPIPTTRIPAYLRRAKNLTRPERGVAPTPLLTLLNPQQSATHRPGAGPDDDVYPDPALWCVSTQIMTCWAPGLLLNSLGGMKDKSIQQAWRARCPLHHHCRHGPYRRLCHRRSPEDPLLPRQSAPPTLTSSRSARRRGRWVCRDGSPISRSPSRRPTPTSSRSPRSGAWTSPISSPTTSAMASSLESPRTPRARLSPPCPHYLPNLMLILILILYITFISLIFSARSPLSPTSLRPDRPHRPSRR